jgi:MarR family 2-MHQ and catechol resistance regulon transcriptional repressor
MAENIELFLKYIDEIVWHFGIHTQDSSCCHGMSYADIRALTEISLENDCSMQNIAQKLGITKSGATRVVDRLQKKALAERRKSETDGRVCCVKATPKGREALKEINDNAYSRMNDVVERIDEPMKQIILTALSSFLSAAKKS